MYIFDLQSKILNTSLFSGFLSSDYQLTVWCLFNPVSTLLKIFAFPLCVKNLLYFAFLTSFYLSTKHVHLSSLVGCFKSCKVVKYYEFADFLHFNILINKNVMLEQYIIYSNKKNCLKNYVAFLPKV